MRDDNKDYEYAPDFPYVVVGAIIILLVMALAAVL